MIDQQTFRQYAVNPAAFRDALIVDVDGWAKKFGSVQDDWQRTDFKALDPALLRVIGKKDPNALMRAYLERPRGHSKTTDIAILCTWLLTFANRPLRGYCYAADKDQANLLKDAVVTLVRMNPWLEGILSVDRRRVVNVGAGHPGADSVLRIETSDVASSYGILPDFIVADEFTHWEGDGSLWHSLISSAAKRSNCLFVSIANAGFVDSWQWSVREAIRTSDNWFFSRLEGPQATWMNDKRLDEQRKMLPEIAYKRLWENEWSTGGGDALTPKDIENAFVSGATPLLGSERGFSFVAGVDLGLKRDCSAIVVLGVRDTNASDAGRIYMAAHRIWKPSLHNQVDLTEVENSLLDLHRRKRTP